VLPDDVLGPQTKIQPYSNFSSLVLVGFKNGQIANHWPKSGKSIRKLIFK
jgi:hypothetical protein